MIPLQILRYKMMKKGSNLDPNRLSFRAFPKKDAVFNSQKYPFHRMSVGDNNVPKQLDEILCDP